MNTFFKNKHHIISPTQIGFQKEISTNVAIVNVCNFLLYMLGCFSGLSQGKAFDTVNREVALFKLERHCIRCITSEMLKDYPLNRKKTKGTNWKCF